MFDLDLTQYPFNKRLQMVRETRRFSRKKLAGMTGIPESTIEKFEYGHADPSVSRLQKIADVLEVETDLLLHGKAAVMTEDETEEEDVMEFDDGGDERIQVNVARKLLSGLDRMRVEGFSKFWRSAPRDIAALSDIILELPCDDLLDLAEERGLFPVPESFIAAHEAARPHEQETMCEGVAVRIVDTAVFGRDLHTCTLESLSDAAQRLDLEADQSGLFTYRWSSIDVVAAALREHLRPLALKEAAPDFLNEEKFKEREVA